MIINNFPPKQTLFKMAWTRTWGTLKVNPNGAETAKFRETWVKNMTTDALAMQGTRASAAMILNMQDKKVLVTCGEGIQLPVSSQCWQII